MYASPFPVTGGKIRVSTTGGTLPRWSRDGRELFYLTTDLHLVTVPVRLAPSLTVGTPTPLFTVRSASKWDDPRFVDGWSDFDVSPDGKRFLAAVARPANEEPLTAVLDWRSGLQK